MRLLQSISSLLLLASGAAYAASTWGFEDASVLLRSRKGEDRTEMLSGKTALSSPLELGSTDAVKLTLTATDGGKPRRPHQVFLMIKDQQTGLEAPFALNIKESGKGVVEVSQKDLPVQLLLASKPLRASIVIGSFGSSKALSAHVFDIDVKLDPNSPPPPNEKPLRYGKQPEIHHIFREDARSPPKVISLFFAVAVLATVPVLLISWLALGANVAHLEKAMGIAPLSHIVFFGSIVAMEGVFFMYYSSWNLFQTLPIIGLVGLVTFLSGTKALGEVQGRRLAGQR